MFRQTRVATYVLIYILMAVKVNFVLNLTFTSPVYSNYLPSIIQIIVTWKVVIAFVQTKFQNQVLVVHVSVISASIFLRTKAVKQGIISGLTD